MGLATPSEEALELRHEFADAVSAEVQGLSITNRFAELLGGLVIVENLVDSGSIFTITIPNTYIAAVA